MIDSLPSQVGWLGRRLHIEHVNLTLHVTYATDVRYTSVTQGIGR